MRNAVIEALLQRDLSGPFSIRQILKGGHPNNRKRFRQRQKPKHIKGIHNGQYFRVKLPPGKSEIPPIPSFPTILPVPQAFKGFMTDKSKMSFESLFPLVGPKQSFTHQVLKWWASNWPTMLLNFGSVCTLLAFTRSDVLELRALSAAGSIGNALYRCTQKPIQWITVAWPSLFASVNGVKIVEILHERNAFVHMDEEQEHIYVEFFLQHGITPKQFQRIEQSAKEFTLKKGEALIRKGDSLKDVYLIVEGSTQAHILGRHLTAQSTSTTTKVKKLGGNSGAWVGEMTFLDRLGEKELQKRAPPKLESTKPSDKSQSTEEGDSTSESPSNEVGSEEKGATNTSKENEPPESKTATLLYTVLAKEDCTVWKWSFEDMEDLMSSSTDLRGALTRAMTSSIVGKVVNMTLSRTNALPHWSTWLSDWVRDDGAKIQLDSVQALPEDRQGFEADDEENGGDLAEVPIL